MFALTLQIRRKGKDINKSVVPFPYWSILKPKIVRGKKVQAPVIWWWWYVTIDLTKLNITFLIINNSVHILLLKMILKLWCHLVVQIFFFHYECKLNLVQKKPHRHFTTSTRPTQLNQTRCPIKCLKMITHNTPRTVNRKCQSRARRSAVCRQRLKYKDAVTFDMYHY